MLEKKLQVAEPALVFIHTKVDWRKHVTGEDERFPFAFLDHSEDGNGNIYLETQRVGYAKNDSTMESLQAIWRSDKRLIMGYCSKNHIDFPSNMKTA
ncbi:hypothetical protein ACHAPU_008083 [Fusarium lateritium]